MALYFPPTQPQGFYRYDPTTLKDAGPARLFSGIGKDGTFFYTLLELQDQLIEQGEVSEPLSLLLHQFRSALHYGQEQWVRLGTFLADWQIFQSPWLNLTLPPDEQFSSAYVSARKQMAAALLAARQATREPDRDVLATLTQFFTNHSTETSIQLSRQQFYRALKAHGRSHPQVMSIHQRDGGLSDREFARQRLAGTNPMVLRRVEVTERELIQPWHQQSYVVATGETVSLGEAMAQNRLFIADYPLLKNLTVTELQTGKYVGSPQALFYRSHQGLYPVLIQLEPGGKVFTADGSDDWLRAKLYTQVADVTHHELITHLCYTHLAMEAFAIATVRQLPSTHPLYRLLRPHFKFLLAINQRGNTVLLGEGAAIDSLLAPTRSASVDLINRAYRERPFQDYALPNHIRRRGIDAEFLPDFAYRDDALLLWEAIARYVSAYLKQYYRDDLAVQQDPYLQAWAAELGAPLNTRPLNEFPQLPNWLPKNLSAQTGIEVSAEALPSYARVPDFPSQEAPGIMTSLSQLIETATQIIFTCGPQHAAVNFSQFDYIGYPPNAPMAAYAKPEDATSAGELLPPLEQDLQQMELTFALSGIIWSRLGDDREIRFADRSDRKILQQFQAQLAEVETEIQKRNRQRLQQDGVDYPYLLPSQIPNSINI
jgi:arachidonate 15-lipoxygenase